MREIKRYVRYYVEGRATDPNSTVARLVLMYFNYDSKRLATSTGMKVAPCDWDEDKQRVKLTVKRAKEVNAYLNLLEQKVNDIYFGALAKDIYPDNNYIIKELKKDKKVEKLTMLEEWKKYLDIRKNNLPKSTHDALRHSFEHFESFAKSMRLHFDDIEPGLLSKYAAYLHTEKGHVDNTIHKHFKRLRSFMAYAKDNGLHNNERYKKFNIQEHEGRIIFLEWDEVKTLIDYQPESENERKVRDAFIFGCLTAMRYGDGHKLRRSEISPVNFEDVDEQFYSANFRQQKTRKLNIVPLLPEARAIIEFYKNEPGDFALPRVRDSEINEAIKEIGRKAGINQKVAVDTYRGGQVQTTYYEKWQLLSTKAGRKTFISCAASKGIPVHICAAVAGHSIKVCLKFYAGVADKERFIRVLKDMKLPAAKPKKAGAEPQPQSLETKVTQNSER